jgi:hypothetical protein
MNPNFNPRIQKPGDPKTLKIAADKCVSRFSYCEEDEIAIVWYFHKSDPYPKTLPTKGTKTGLYTTPRGLSGIIVFSNNVDDIIWEQELKEQGIEYRNRWISEKKLLTRLESSCINITEVH